MRADSYHWRAKSGICPNRIKKRARKQQTAYSSIFFLLSACRSLPLQGFTLIYVVMMTALSYHNRQGVLLLSKS